MRLDVLQRQRQDAQHLQQLEDSFIALLGKLLGRLLVDRDERAALQKAARDAQVSARGKHGQAV